MNLLNKINISKLTYIIIFLAVITGQFRYMTYIAILLFFHGIGHIIISTRFKWKINKITIFPFGGNIKYNIRLNESISKEFLVTIAGPLFQLIITLIFENFKFLSLKELMIFKNISYTLLLFNMLPIVPLDGSKLIFLILNKFTSYNKSHIYLIYISIFSLIVFCVETINVLTFQAIIFVLIFSIVKEYKSHNLIINKFLLERYLEKNRGGKIKLLKKLNPKLIWKERKNIFIYNKKIIKEEIVLTNYFKKNI